MNQASERSTPQFRRTLASTFLLSNKRLFAVALLLSVAPLWFGRYLPLVDLPQHAAQIAALNEIWADNPTFTELFQVNWFTPYLLGYMLLYLFSLFLPITVASKILVSLAVVSIPILTGALLRNSGADERWKWLAIPGSFSFAFYWGFLSFMVAAPLALGFLIQTVRFVQQPTARNSVLIAAYGIFLFFCHIIVLGFASVVALGYVLGSRYRDPRQLFVMALPYMAPLPLIAAWLFWTYSTERIVQDQPTVYGFFIDRLTALLTQPAGADGRLPLVTLTVTGAIAFLPKLCGGTWSSKPERWLPFALGLLVFVLAPSYVFSTAFFYQRLGIFLTPLWFLAWDAPAVKKRSYEWLAMAVVLVWAFANTARFAAFARETESFDKISSAMTPGSRVASMIFDNTSPLFTMPVYLHFPAWYQARQAGIVDFNFADFFSQMVRYKKDAGPRMTDMLGWYPLQFQWDVNGGEKYDYFLVKAPADISNEIFKEKRGSVELVERSGWWWLYRNAERPQRAPGK